MAEDPAAARTQAGVVQVTATKVAKTRRGLPSAADPSDAALVDRFLDDPRQRRLAAQTRGNKRRALRRFSDSLDAGLLEASTDDATRWLASRRPLGHAGLRNLLSILHAFYIWAEGQGLVADAATTPLLSSRRTQAEAITAGRLHRLNRLSAAPGEHSLDTQAAAYVVGRLARREISALTSASMASALSLFCDVMGDVAPAELSRDGIERWLASMRRLAPSTRRRRFSQIRCFLRWLVETEQLGRDPSAGIASPKVPHSVHRALSGERAQALLEVCADSRERLVVTLGLQLGLRRAEIAGLELGDIDMVHGTLIVRHGKGGNQRILPLTEVARRALACYLAEYRFSAGPLLRVERYPERGVTPTFVGRMVSRLAYDAEVKVGAGDGVGCHSLRHTAATDIYVRTHDVMAVRDVLGHVSLANTQIYVRGLDVEGLREAMEGRTYRDAPRPARTRVKAG